MRLFKRLTAVGMCLLLLLPVLSAGTAVWADEETGGEETIVDTPAEPAPEPETPAPAPDPEPETVTEPETETEPAPAPAEDTPAPDTPSHSDDTDNGQTDTPEVTDSPEVPEITDPEAQEEETEEEEESIFSGGGSVVDKYTVLTTLVDSGFTEQAACAIMASIWTESGFSTGATNQTDGGFGLFQWTFSRRDNFEAYCSSTGSDPYSFAVQITYLIYELQNSYGSVYDFMIEPGHTAYEYGYIFSHGFEGDYEEYNRQVASNAMVIYSAYRDHGADFESYIINEGRRSAGVVASVAVLSYSDEAPEITLPESDSDLVNCALPLAVKLNYQLTDSTKWDGTFVVDEYSTFDTYLGSRLAGYGGTAEDDDDLFTRYLSVCAAECGLCSWQFALTGSAEAQVAQLCSGGSEEYAVSDVALLGGGEYMAVPGDLAVLLTEDGYKLALVAEVTEDYLAVLEFNDNDVPVMLYCGENYTIVDKNFQIEGGEDCWLLDENTKIIHPQTTLSISVTSGEEPVYRSFRLNEYISDVLTVSVRGCTPMVLLQYSLDGRNWISVPEDFVETEAEADNTVLNDGLTVISLNVTGLAIQVAADVVDGHFWVRIDSADTTLAGQRMQRVFSVYEPQAVNNAEMNQEDTAGTVLPDTEECFGEPPVQQAGASGVPVTDRFPVYADRLNVRVWQWVFFLKRMPIEY